MPTSRHTMTPNAQPTQAPLAVGGRVRLIVETVTSYVAVRRLARAQPLPEVLATLRSELGGPAMQRAITDNPYRLSAIVQRVLWRLPTDTRCLMQSLTLLSLLTRRGIDAKVIISTSPGESFGAHAWLELDGRPLLKPDPDHLRLVEL